MPDTPLERITKLVTQFSPSIIPELRGDAAKKRKEYRDRSGTDSYDKTAIYPYDFVCDFVEAVFKIIGEANEPETIWNAQMKWECYDELRNYGRPDADPD